MSSIVHSSGRVHPVIDVLKRRIGDARVPVFELELPDGAMSVFGQAGTGYSSASSPAFRLCLKDDNAVRALASLDEYAIAEAYLDGHIDLEGDVLAAFELRGFFSDSHPLLSLWRYLRPLINGYSAQNRTMVPRHYDRGNNFYFSFLDTRHRLYSQALYAHESESLEDAASNKLDYIASICRIGPGTRVLDIGAGWGSFSRFAAGLGADVTMLTVSEEQRKHLQRVIDEAGEEQRMRVILEDVFAFEPDERFDAIVMLGVMEHLPQYRRLMKHFADILAADGRIYMDFSAVERKFDVSTFTYRYVFEGKVSPVYMPGLISAANRLPFEMIEVKNDRHSYFLTVREWATRLEAERDALARDFGERTFRLFQLYLWATASGLQRDGALESYRIVFQKSRGRPSRTIGL